jgi:hypothetical protein
MVMSLGQRDAQGGDDNTGDGHGHAQADLRAGAPTGVPIAGLGITRIPQARPANLLSGTKPPPVRAHPASSADAGK